MSVSIGIFVVPDATDATATLAQILAADDAGLDVVGIQDHPYQRRFFDTWTLLSYAAGRTKRVRLVPDVLNLPLRPPALIAKSAASLDILSSGRVDLGLGAGAFWDAIEALGGPRRSPRESVDALEEAIAIIRAFWTSDTVEVRGEHYAVKGATPGPKPTRPIGIWLGAYGPRMLRLTGRLADGWLPSLGERYLKPEDAVKGHAAIDEAARAAGRRPEEIERVVNVMSPAEDPRRSADDLVKIVSELGFSTLLVSVPSADAVDFVRRLGEDVAPRVRERAG
jgi:alkanesulfonate monooxygenase SsuD/methylene tetrahydromethanopterin reductase-like flavin-dependent oxidoreductase (luciferase family)